MNTMIAGRAGGIQLEVTYPSSQEIELHRQWLQVLGDNPPIVYSGSLERVDFGEERDTKGFYLVELDETLALFEEGRKLLNECSKELEEAEGSLRKLTVEEAEQSNDES